MTNRSSVQIFADDLTIGQTFVGEARRIGDDQFRAFADMTGDDHPIHYDDAYAAKTRFGKRLAHGLLVMSMTALGATAMSRQIEDAMVAFVEEGARFLKPVFVGDTLTSRFEVAAIDPKPARGTALVRFNVSLSNDRNEVVLEGHHCYLLLLRSSAQGFEATGCRLKATRTRFRHSIGRRCMRRWGGDRTKRCRSGPPSSIAMRGAGVSR